MTDPAIRNLRIYINNLYEAGVVSKFDWSRLSELLHDVSERITPKTVPDDN